MSKSDWRRVQVPAKEPRFATPQGANPFSPQKNNTTKGEAPNFLGWGFWGMHEESALSEKQTKEGLGILM